MLVIIKSSCAMIDRSLTFNDFNRGQNTHLKIKGDDSTVEIKKKQAITSALSHHWYQRPYA